MVKPPRALRNRFLLALPPGDLERLLPELAPITCERHQVLVETDSSLDDVFFPNYGLVSAVAVYADGDVIEMATIGREGFTAVQAVLGVNKSSARFFIQVPGTAMKMPRAAFLRAMRTMPSFQRLAQSYLLAFLEQVMVSAACNGAHNVNERLARWLLMMRDRNDGDSLSITQDILAQMLGVRRPTVTKAVREFERAGWIHAGRGLLSIRNRQGLLGASCECYALLRTRVAQHLPKTYPET